MSRLRLTIACLILAALAAATQQVVHGSLSQAAARAVQTGAYQPNTCFGITTALNGAAASGPYYDGSGNQVSKSIPMRDANQLRDEIQTNEGKTLEQFKQRLRQLPEEIARTRRTLSNLPNSTRPNDVLVRDTLSGQLTAMVAEQARLEDYVIHINCNGFFRAVGAQLGAGARPGSAWADGLSANDIGKAIRAGAANPAGEWAKVDEREVQARCNAGEVVVGSSMSRGHGHLGFCAPNPLGNTPDGNSGPLVRDGNEHILGAKQAGDPARYVPTTYGAASRSATFGDPPEWYVWKPAGYHPNFADILQTSGQCFRQARAPVESPNTSPPSNPPSVQPPKSGGSSGAGLLLGLGAAGAGVLVAYQYMCGTPDVDFDLNNICSAANRARYDKLRRYCNCANHSQDYCDDNPYFDEFVRKCGG